MFKVNFGLTIYIFIRTAIYKKNPQQLNYFLLFENIIKPFFLCAQIMLDIIVYWFVMCYNLDYLWLTTKTTFKDSCLIYGYEKSLNKAKGLASV